MSSRTDRESRRRMVEFAERNGGALTRADAAGCGVGAHAIALERAAGRLEVVGRAIRVVGAPATLTAQWLCALANSGPRAALDGVTALEAAGLAHFTEPLIHVGLPKGARAWQSSSTVAHHVRGWNPADVVTDGCLRYTRPAVAALRAALWLPTSRAGATVLAMAVQQGLVDVTELTEAATALPRRRRRADILATLDELRGGCQSINELDLAAGCRRRGLPEPSRQVVVKTPSGVFVLDVEWDEFDVHLEVNGTHHMAPDRSYRDDLKHNEMAITRDCSLRVPSYAIRNDDDVVYDQIERALRSRGWSPPKR